MRLTILAVLAVLLMNVAQAQIKAITQDGDEVILYGNGTWKYTKDISTDAQPKVVTTNNTVFEKSKASTFQLKSKKVNFGFSFNPNVWKINTKKFNEVSEFELIMKQDDVYAIFIVEKLPIPLEKLREIAFNNIIGVDPDAKVLKEEYRTVNNNKVLMLKVAATIQGIPFMYLNYYFSCENGIVQMMSYTSKEIFEKHETDCETLLNGFELIK